MKNKVQNLIGSANQKANALFIKAKVNTISAEEVLTNRRGESPSVGAAVGIIVSVVIGLFLMNKMLELFSADILPSIRTKIKEMFNAG